MDLQNYFAAQSPPRDHFAAVLRHWEQVRPDSLAFSFTDGDEIERRLTYAQLWDEASGLAGYLQGHCGIRAGDRVLLIYPPGLDFVVALFACFAAGAVAVPAFPPRRNRKASRIRSIVIDADARWALSTQSVVDQLSGENLHEDLVGVQLLGTDHPDRRDPTRLRQTRPISSTLAGVNGSGGSPLGVLQYTSGSTGSPKGVMLSHSNLVANSELILHAFEPDKSIVGMSWLPTYHDMGLIGGILMPMYIGRPVVLMSPMAFLQKPSRWLQTISREQVTISGGPNFAYQLCVDKIDDSEIEGIDLTSWEIAFNGAEPIRSSTLHAFTERFSKFGFRATSHLPCYGMAETTLIVTGGPREPRPVLTRFNGKELDKKQVVEASAAETPSKNGEGKNGQGKNGDQTGSNHGMRELVGCGRVLPGERIEIVDPDSLRVLAKDRIGEIWVQSPSVGMGYWQRGDESQRTFSAMTTDGQGPFLRTGDLGFLHEGQLYVSGRLKDMIIVRGVNRYPQDIEATVERASEIVQAGSVAAFAMTDSEREQLVIVAETIRQRNCDWDEHIQSIRRAVTQEHDLPPDAVYLVRNSSVPKTSSGKIQRHACLHAVRDNELKVTAQWVRGEESAGAASRGSADTAGSETMMKAASAASALDVQADPIVVDAIETHVRQIAGERAGSISTDTNIVLDLGLDSLERLEIARNLEQTFGGRFPEQVLDEIETIGQTAAAVERYLPAGARGRAEAFLSDPGTGRRAPAKVEADTNTDADANRIRRAQAVTPEDDVTQFAEYKRLQSTMRQMQLTGVPNPYFTVHEGVVDDKTTVDGQELISFASYNYLGLSGHPEVSQAAADATFRFGTSVSASRLVSGEKPIHGELEQLIAKWIGVDNAITMVGGHATNETTIGHLVGPGDLILHDGLSHNSIVQGALLSGAKRRPFPHNDYDALDRMLAALRGQYRRTLVIVEGVYSMDGDFADVPKFVEVKKRHRAMLMVDEAHSFGTMGETGHGISEHFGLNARDVDIWMGTLSKSASSCGGYIAGSHALVELLRYTAPGFVFSVGMPPGQVAAAIASLKVLQREPERVQRLRNNSERFLKLCQEAGLDTGDSGGTPVVPVITGNSLVALRLSNRLRKDGINVQPILYPAVDESAARLRFFITSEHTDDQITFTVERTIAHYRELLDSAAAPLLETG